MMESGLLAQTNYESTRLRLKHRLDPTGIMLLQLQRMNTEDKKLPL